MKEIEVKGLKQYYFTGQEKLPSTIHDGTYEWTVSESIPSALSKYINDYKNIRVIVERGVTIWKEAYIFYIYWYLNVDLDPLDQKVLDGKCENSCFEDTIILTYQKTKCREGCGI